ncbi:MAG: hypothetical protein LBK06_10905 [Planctomycetaceae bacterium]|jgi:hypothetical protein|nr:hypothetical protein [Planctomycetaceae bacterium]
MSLTKIKKSNLLKLIMASTNINIIADSVVIADLVVINITANDVQFQQTVDLQDFNSDDCNKPIDIQNEPIVIGETMTNLNNKNKKEWWQYFDLWDMFTSSKPYFLQRFPGDGCNPAPIDPKVDPVGYLLDKCMSIAVALVVTVFSIIMTIICLCILLGAIFPVK